MAKGVLDLHRFMFDGHNFLSFYFKIKKNYKSHMSSTNYGVWKFKIQTNLEREDLWEFV